jgi:hypothetical protein
VLLGFGAYFLKQCYINVNLRYHGVIFKKITNLVLETIAPYIIEPFMTPQGYEVFNTFSIETWSFVYSINLSGIITPHPLVVVKFTTWTSQDFHKFCHIHTKVIFYLGKRSIMKPNYNCKLLKSQKGFKIKFSYHAQFFKNSPTIFLKKLYIFNIW